MKGVFLVMSTVLTGLGIFSFGLISEAQAHVFPVHSEPKVGQVVNTSPFLVRIWFDGKLEPAFSTIEVHDLKGARVDKGDGRVGPEDRTLLKISLPSLPSGIYRVFWSVVSQDGHLTEGDFSFTIRVSQ